MAIDQSLAGRTAVITGGAGGIGLACAQAFATAGATLVILDISLAAAQAAAKSVGCHAVQADVGDEASMSTALATVERLTGGADILVNSAAIFQAPVKAMKLRMSKWDDVVRVSQRGTFLACTMFGTRMADRGGGAIVNIASVAGTRAMPLHAYGPAKAAVIAMTASLAAEWGMSGVRVNAVSPGFTRTAAVQSEINGGRNPSAPILAGTPMGRLVEPDEVAQAALFLASHAASAITGVNLPVDCGWLAGGGWQAYGGLPRDPTVAS